MKRITSILLLLSCILPQLGGCSDDDSKKLQVEELAVLTVTPANGTECQAGVVEVAFEFNQPVEILDTTKITVNGVSVDYAYTVARLLKAKVVLTKPGKVSFKIGEGAISVFRSSKSNDMAYQTDFAIRDQSSVDGIHSKEAQRLLDYMRDNTGIGMLSGVCACINWNQNEAFWVYKHTGKYPAINNFDFIHYEYSSPGGWIDYSNPSPALTWAENNGVVSAMWHWNQRANNGYDSSCTPGSAPDQTSFSPSAIFDPESDGYKKMIHDIDIVAGWMKPLAEAGIPILWRPLHEAQGNWDENLKDEWRKAWFWWGIDGPEACVEIWKVMYDRMVIHHGLTNLIWVCNIGSSRLWYPGDEYVDIVGYDFYNSSMDDMVYWYEYMERNYPTKLRAICECGNIPKISDQWERGLFWNYFTPWWDNARTQDMNADSFNSTDHNNCNIDWWNDALDCSFVLTRDMLPSFR